MTQYFVVCLLTKFNESAYDQMLKDPETLLFELHEKDANSFKFMEIYDNCEYENLLKLWSVELKKYVEKIEVNVSIDAIFNGLRLEIITKILSKASQVKIKYLKELFKDEKSDFEKEIKEASKRIKKRITIDDVDKVVVIHEKNPLNEAVEKSLEISWAKASDVFKMSYSKLKIKGIKLSDTKNLKQMQMQDINMIDQH